MNRLITSGVMAAFSFLCAISPIESSAAKILFIAGPGSHGYGAHEFRAGSLLLADELEESGLDLEVVVSENGWPEDASVFDDVAAVVMMCTGEDKHLLNQHIEFFDGLAEKGVGLAMLHTSVITITGEASDHFLKWVGGFHELYYSVVAHWEADFAALPDHPVTNGVKPFVFNDEWYYFMRFVPDMKGVTPILSAHPDPQWLQRRKPGKLGGGYEARAALANDEIQHVAWAYEREGGGRGFGFTGGHDHWYFADPNYRKLVLNAICWTANMDLPEHGVPVQDLSINDLLANQDDNPPVGATADAVISKYPVKVKTSLDAIQFAPRMPLQWDNGGPAKKVAFVAGHRGADYGELEQYASCTLLGEELEKAYDDVDVAVFVHPYPKNIYDTLSAADTVVFYTNEGRANPFDKGAKPLLEFLEGDAGAVVMGSGLRVSANGKELLYDTVGARSAVDEGPYPEKEFSFNSFPDHPVSQGLKKFKVIDGWVSSLEYADSVKDSTVILRDNAGNPLLWLFEESGRRRVGFAGGHHHFALGNAVYRKALLNAIAWSAHLPVPLDGVDTEALSLDDLVRNQNHTLSVFEDRDALVEKFGLVE